MNQAIETGVALRDRMSVLHSAERLVAQGKLSQADLEAEIAQIKRERQGDTPNGSQMATYTAANEREFAELCEQYSQILDDVKTAVDDVKTAVQVRDLAYANAEEASEHWENARWKKGQTEERLRAYALLFGFPLPDELKAPEYEEDIPF